MNLQIYDEIKAIVDVIYQIAIGSLVYVMICIWIDIAYIYIYI